MLFRSPRGALAAFHNYEKDGQDLGFTMFADDLETAQALLALIPPKPSFITVHEALYRDELEKRFGFTRLNPCWQLGWLRTTPPLPDAAADIRQLDQSHLPAVLANYTLTGEEYLIGEDLTEGEHRAIIERYVKEAGSFNGN